MTKEETEVFEAILKLAKEYAETSERTTQISVEMNALITKAKTFLPEVSIDPKEGNDPCNH